MLDLSKYFYKISALAGWRYPAFINRLLAISDKSKCSLIGASGVRQFSHPDLMQVGKTKYLAMTPYPYGVDLYENPEVFVSEGSSRWKFLATVPSPRKGKHLSDPDLLFFRNKLFLVYRRCDRNSTGLDELILRDLGNGAERILLTGPKNSLICPSAIAGEFVSLFVVDARNGRRILLKYDFNEEWNFISVRECECDLPELWHIDVIKDKEELKGLFLSNRGNGKYGNSLFLMESKDGGHCFRRKVEFNIEEDDIEFIYRASLQYSGDEYTMALSYCTTKGKWRICFYRIEIHEGNYRLYRNNPEYCKD